MQSSGNSNFIIKSFKHNGNVHRMWLENWRVPDELLHKEDKAESMIVFVNSHTKIQEADGRQWVSKIPGVSFFIPGEWFNVIGLIEDQGVRYYCNLASPPYIVNQVLTYIDYDLDVIVGVSGEAQVVDHEEYERHKAAYHYNQAVQQKIDTGMTRLMQRIEGGRSPFEREAVQLYYEYWQTNRTGG